jgi:hypothetical protein
VTAPTIRQRNVGSMEKNQADTTWIINLQNNTNANNALRLFIEANSADTISSVTDNIGGNNWAQAATVSSGQSGHLWIATGITAGINQITVVLNVSDQFVQFNVAEIAYVSTAAVASALDGTPSTATGIATTSIASGSITTTADGSFIEQFVFDVNQTGGMAFTAGASPWAITGAQLVDGIGIQSQVQTTHGAITPSLTRAAGAATFNTIAYAIKADPTKGDATLANGSVSFLQTQNTQPGPTSYVFQFPCTGDCLVMCGLQGDPAIATSNVTDTNSNGWAVAKSHAAAGGTGNGTADVWVAGSSTPSQNLKITVTIGTSVNRIGTIKFYDIVQAAASPVGTTNQYDGNQTSVGSPFDLPWGTFTPSTANSCVIFCGGIFSHTTLLLKGGSGWMSDISTDPASDGSNITLDEADSFGHWYNGATLSAQNVGWNIQNSNASGVGTWVGVAVEIKSAVAASTIPLMGQICL